MDIGGWPLWVLAAIILGALEAAVPGFVLLWFSAGALAAGLIAALGLGINAQLIAFITVSMGLLGASRTIFKKALMRGGANVSTGVDAMVGQEAVVTETIGEPHGGTVRINGELWTARSLAGPLPAGERVVVEQVEGLKLWVRRPSASIEVSSKKQSQKEED